MFDLKSEEVDKENFVKESHYYLIESYFNLLDMGAKRKVGDYFLCFFKLLRYLLSSNIAKRLGGVNGV